MSRGQTILHELRRRIVLNELRPGTVLTELSLAAELQGSQGAVREALLRLEGEGLVTRSGHQGTAVTDLGPAEAAEMLHLRRQIEGRAASAIAARLSRGDETTLEHLTSAMETAAASNSQWHMILADTEFHLTLFRTAGLAAMEPILARCILHTHRSRLWAPWHDRPLQQTADRHRDIMAAARSRNGRRLRQALERHIDTIVERGTAE
jgi:DNA-binding GntR family transcriptional regulator